VQIQKEFSKAKKSLTTNSTSEDNNVKGCIVLFDKFKKYIKYPLNRFVSDLFCFVLWYDGLK